MCFKIGRFSAARRIGALPCIAGNACRREVCRVLTLPLALLIPADTSADVWANLLPRTSVLRWLFPEGQHCKELGS